jgi:hypothetical protein
MTARTRRPITSSMTTLDGRRKQAATRRHIIHLLIPGALRRSPHHRTERSNSERATKLPTRWAIGHQQPRVPFCSPSHLTKISIAWERQQQRGKNLRRRVPNNGARLARPRGPAIEQERPARLHGTRRPRALVATPCARLPQRGRGRARPRNAYLAPGASGASAGPEIEPTVTRKPRTSRQAGERARPRAGDGRRRAGSPTLLAVGAMRLPSVSPADG